MKYFVTTILFVILYSAKSQTNTHSMVKNAAILSDTANYEVGLQYDTSYYRHFNIDLNSLNGVSQVKIVLIDDNSNNTINTTTVNVPANDIQSSTVLAINRAGNKLSFNLGSFSLLNVYRLRFYVIDANGFEMKVYECEF